MKSELSFLLELILDEQTPGPMKNKLVARVRDVEKNYTTEPKQSVLRGTIPKSAQQVVQAQSPSMQRLMEQNPDLIPKAPTPITPAAASALAERQAKINAAILGKEEKERATPRKF